MRTRRWLSLAVSLLSAVAIVGCGQQQQFVVTVQRRPVVQHVCQQLGSGGL